jgi:hypothetical protein
MIFNKDECKNLIAMIKSSDESNQEIGKTLLETNNLEQNIIQYASSNNLGNSTIQISDGKLKFVNTTVTESLTFKYVEKTLGEVIKNHSQVELIINHLKQKRSVKKTQEIKRYSNN